MDTLGFLSESVPNPKRVLVILPAPYIQRTLEDYNIQGKFEYHWLTDPDTPELFGSNVAATKISMKFNVLNFISRAVEYVKVHKIDSVTFFHDFAGLLAAIICEETGLRGPSVESSFLCIHKYYSRQAEPSNLWFEAIELDKDDWSTRIQYPCCVKAPFMFRSMCIFIVNNENEMKAALESCRTELSDWGSIWKSLFEIYVDTEKYPLALKDMVIAEEVVADGTQHTIEGWVDGEGNPYIWLTSDEGYYTKPHRTVDGYFMPTQVPKRCIKSMEDVALKVARNHHLRDTFFNVEAWCRNDGEKITVTEVNNRSAYVYHHLYMHVYGTSCIHAALHLACGEYEEVHKLSIAQQPPANRVGGLFLVQVHVKEAEEATTVVDFQAAKAFQKEVPAGTQVELLSNLGPGINIIAKEDDVIYPVGSCGVLVASYNVFKPTFHEVLKRADEVRKTIIRCKDILPQNREPEYYLDNCGAIEVL